MQSHDHQPMPSPEVEILRVRRAGPPATRVRAFDIDAPLAGKLDPSIGLLFSGWVAATDIPVTGVALFCNESLLRAAPLKMLRRDAADRMTGVDPACGFAFVMSAMEVPAEFELILYAVSQNAPLVQLATITGRHTAEKNVIPAKLRPLMLTSLGRSGTTYFMQLLSAHPGVVADRTYPYESNAAAYWMHVFRAESAVGVVQPDGTRPTPSLARSLHRTPPLTHFLNTVYPSIAARFCRDAIEGYYSQLAGLQNHPDAVYFCEKILDFAIGYVFWNMYPAGRQIFLVRDFRDVVCSVLAFNAKRGEQEFGRERVASDEAYIPELRNAARALLANFRGRADILLVRYEELIQRPRETLAAVLQYLALDDAPAAIDAMIADAQKQTPELKQHRTTGSAEASIGRWRHDLSPEMQSLCRQNFDDLLPQFGYKLDKDGTLQLAPPEH